MRSICAKIDFESKLRDKIEVAGMELNITQLRDTTRQGLDRWRQVLADAERGQEKTQQSALGDTYRDTHTETQRQFAVWADIGCKGNRHNKQMGWRQNINSLHCASQRNSTV